MFRKLFLAGKPAEQARQVQRLRDGQSILDVVMEKNARAWKRRLSGRDREKLDQYFEAVREAERRLAKAEAWEQKPKPSSRCRAARRRDGSRKIVERMRLMYDVMHLALETDSTRFITYNFAGMNSVPVIPGVDIDYHNLSHHGKDPAKIDQLTIVESARGERVRPLPEEAAREQEADGSLLDSTMVLFGSNLGNASSHDTQEHADPLGRRRLSTRPASGVRPRQQLSAAEPVRLDAATTGHGNRHLRHRHRTDGRPGSVNLTIC